MIVLTHNDLDAVGCELCLRHTNLKIDKIFYEDYITLKETVRDIVSYGTKNKISTVFVCDMSFAEKPELLQSLLNHFDTVIHLDHHSYPEGFSVNVRPNCTFKQIIDPSRCGCKIVYDVLKLNIPYLNAVIEVIDKFDRFVVDSPLFEKSVSMNSYFWKYGYQNFLEQFKNGIPVSYSKDIEILNEETSRELEEQVKKGQILQSDKVTIKFGDIHFVEAELKAFNQGQRGFLCVTPGNIKIRLNNRIFSQQEAEYLRSKILDSVCGHPHAFVRVFKNDNPETSFGEIQRICGIINSYKGL